MCGLPQASIAFTEAKKCFSSAIEPLEESHRAAIQLAEKTASPEFEDLKALPTARVAEILRVVERSEMKVVFFGRTSNGKSTVINALLKSKVLPFGPGSTTSSISHLRGAASECSFVKFEGSDELVAVEVCFQLWLMYVCSCLSALYTYMCVYSVWPVVISLCLYLFLFTAVCSGTG